MFKRKLISMLICIVVLVCISGCDSLWNVNRGTSVTLDLGAMGILKSNITAYPISRDSKMPRGIDNAANNNGYNVLVSLLDSNTDQIVVSQTLTFNDDDFDDDDGLQVTFNDIKVGQSIYATIDIIHNAQKLLTDEAIMEGVKLDDTYFKGRSDSTVIREAKTVLITKPAAIFFMPSGGDEYISEIDYDSDSNGLTPYEPKTNLNEAYKALGGANAPEGSVIYVMDTINDDIDHLDNKPNVVIKRFKSSKNVVDITKSFDQTIGDVIIDGNKEKLIATDALISNEKGTILTLNGTIIQNSKVYSNDVVQASAIQVSGETLIINSATITNNEIVDDGSDPTGQSKNGVGGAIFIQTEFAGRLSFGNGLITIANNYDKNGENNVFYDISKISPILLNVRAISDLHPDSRIGIYPYVYDDIDFTFKTPDNDTSLLVSYDTALQANSNTPYFTLDNFILDILGNLEIVGSDLVYKNQ